MKLIPKLLDFRWKALEIEDYLSILMIQNREKIHLCCKILSK